MAYGLWLMAYRHLSLRAAWPQQLALQELPRRRGRRLPALKPQEVVDVVRDHQRFHVHALFQQPLFEIDRLMELDRKSTRLNSSHIQKSRMPSSA